MDKTYDIPLHDIKPLVEIQEYSMEYLIVIGTLLFVLIIAVIYLVLKWLRHKKRYSIRKEHLKLIKAIDFSDTKNAAYKLTLYGNTFKNDTPRHEKAYQELFDSLQGYKYKKSVENFNRETLHFIEIYKGMLDV